MGLPLRINSVLKIDPVAALPAQFDQDLWQVSVHTLDFWTRTACNNNTYQNETGMKLLLFCYCCCWGDGARGGVRVGGQGVEGNGKWDMKLSCAYECTHIRPN